FLPVRDGDVSLHRMHAERYEVPPATLEAVAAVRRSGGRVFAVGTTAARALESWARSGTANGETTLFIPPAFDARAVDGLVTNCPLPKSTLLMLVAAFLGRERTLEVYARAVAERYRFFSYGDAMLIDPREGA